VVEMLLKKAVMILNQNFIGRPLFIVNLELQPNEEVAQCLADKRIRAQCQLHPILAEENDIKNYPLYEQTELNYSQTTSEMELLTGHNYTLIHLENGMTGQW